MKKLIALILTTVSLNVFAFTGTGNDKIEYARAYLAFQNGAGGDEAGAIYWLGIVQGLSTMYSMPFYPNSVCYPSDSNGGQLAEVAGNYMIANPEKRHETTAALVLEAHFAAFGWQSDDSCHKHQHWLEFNS